MQAATQRGAPPFRADLGAPVARWAATWQRPGLERRLHISFSTRMTRSLGRCHPERGVIRLASWLRDAPASLLAEVLCHEVAHVATWELHGRACRPHGAEWRALMRAAGFEPRVRLPAELVPSAVRARRARPTPPPISLAEQAAQALLQQIRRSILR